MCATVKRRWLLHRSLHRYWPHLLLFYTYCLEDGKAAADQGGEGGDRHFHIGSCHADSVDIYLAKMLLDNGDLNFILPDPNFSVWITQAPSCRFSDKGDKLMWMLQGIGSEPGRVNQPSMQELPPVIAVAGCACPSSTTILAEMAASAGRFIPIVSGEVTDAHLTETGLYPTFMRTIPSVDVQGTIQAKLIIEFGWRYFIWLVTVEIEAGLSMSEAAHKEFQEQPDDWVSGITLQRLSAIALTGPSDWASFSLPTVHSELKTLFDPHTVWHRIVVLSGTSAKSMLVLLREMSAYGCVRKESVVILPEALCSDVLSYWSISASIGEWMQVDPVYFSDPFWVNPLEPLRGSLCTAPGSVSTWLAEGSDFVNWLNTVTTDGLRLAGAPDDISFPGAESWFRQTVRPYVFDSVMAIFQAISMLLYQGVETSSIKGQILLTAMLEQHFYGISGNVAFLESGERQETTYFVRNIQMDNMTQQEELVNIYVYVITANTTGDPQPAQRGQNQSAPSRSSSMQRISGTEVIFASGFSEHGDRLLCPVGQEPRAQFNGAPPGGPGQGSGSFDPATRSEVCMDCPLGRMWAQGTSSCQDCAAGYFSGVEGSTTCSFCPSGSFSDSAGASACEPCARGHAQNLVAQVTCDPCKPGRFASEIGETLCEPCPQGQFQTGQAHTACNSCDLVVTGSSTAQLEALSETACGCPKDTYQMDSDGESVCAPAPEGRTCQFDSRLENCSCVAGNRASGRDVTCVPCEEYLQCPGGHPAALWNSFDTTVSVFEGYMTLPHEPYSVYSCVSDNVCRSTRSPFALSGPMRVCKEGVQVIPRCGACGESRYGSPQFGCHLCSSQDKLWFIVKVLLSFMSNVLVIVYLYNRFNRPNPAGMITLSCLISMLQSLVTIGKIPLDWPSSLFWTFKTIEAVASLEGVFGTLQFRMECMVGSDYRWGVARMALSPLVVFLDFFILYVCGKVVQRPLKWDFVHNIIGLVFTRLFISIVGMSLILFYRVHMPNKKEMVREYPQLEFFSSDWMRVLPINALATLIYGGTTVSYITHLVLSAPQRVAVDPSFMAKARFCFGSFRPNRHWWILFQLAYAFALNLAQVVVPSSNVHGKLYLAALFLISFTVVEFRVQPFKFAQNNAVDLTQHVVLITLLVVATAFIDLDDVSRSELKQWRRIYAALLVIMICGATMLAMYHILEWVWSTCQVKGYLEGKRLRIAWQFRDCAVAMLLLTDQTLMRRMSTLGDYDLMKLKAAKETMITVLFGSQVSERSLTQRLIPGEPFKLWSYQDMQVNVWDKINSGEFVQKVKHAFKAQAWLLKMAREANRMAGSSSTKSTSAKSSGSAEPIVMIDGNYRSVGEMPSSPRSHRAALDPVKQASKALQKRLDFHMDALINVLDIDPGPLSRNEFHDNVRMAFPRFKISHEEIDMIFDIASFDGTGELRKDHFLLMVGALLPQWLVRKAMGGEREDRSMSFASGVGSDGAGSPRHGMMDDSALQEMATQRVLTTMRTFLNDTELASDGTSRPDSASSGIWPASRGSGHARSCSHVVDSCSAEEKVVTSHLEVQESGAGEDDLEQGELVLEIGTDDEQDGRIVAEDLADEEHCCCSAFQGDGDLDMDKQKVVEPRPNVITV